MVLNDTVDKLVLVDSYRTLYSKTVEYTSFSSVHGTFSRIDHMLGHKTSLNKFKRIEIISSNCSNHNGMKLEINYRKKNGKNTNTWRLNNMLLKTNGSMKKSKRKSENTPRQVKIKTQLSKIYGSTQKQS